MRRRILVLQRERDLGLPGIDRDFLLLRLGLGAPGHQAGDKPRSVTLTGPGVVDVFCNIHQKMSAKILVVPSVLFTKVRSDGTFLLENVPAGQRRLVAWSPETKPQQQRVAVNGGKTEISFSLQHEDPAAHPNKLGQAYGSYKD